MLTWGYQSLLEASIGNYLNLNSIQFKYLKVPIVDPYHQLFADNFIL